jgi:hypothetical protein
MNPIQIMVKTNEIRDSTSFNCFAEFIEVAGDHPRCAGIMHPINVRRISLVIQE